MRTLLIVTAPLAAIVAVALGLWLSGGDSDTDSDEPTVNEFVQQPNAEDTHGAAPTETKLPPAPSVTPVESKPTRARMTNRQDCGIIRGTDYLSADERQWFISNCTAPGPAVVESPFQPPPSSSLNRRDCDLISSGSTYLSVKERDWYIINCLKPLLAPEPVIPPPAQAPNSLIQTCYDGTFRGWGHDNLYELCNGQIWLQTSFDLSIALKLRPDVTIQEVAGGYEMTVEGVRGSASVTRITDFVRTCIAGPFEGWSGDTVFELCNGQVWVQASYAYTYHYAYRPDVIIFATGGGYSMAVEGVDRRIAVRLIR